MLITISPLAADLVVKLILLANPHRLRPRDGKYGLPMKVLSGRREMVNTNEIVDDRRSPHIFEYKVQLVADLVIPHGVIRLTAEFET